MSVGFVLPQLTVLLRDRLEHSVHVGEVLEGRAVKVNHLCEVSRLARLAALLDKLISTLLKLWVAAVES